MTVHNLPKPQPESSVLGGLALVAIVLLLQVLILWSLAWWFAVTWLVRQI